MSFEFYPAMLLLCAYIEYKMKYLFSAFESYETWCLVKSYGSQGRGGALFAHFSSAAISDI